MGIEIERKYLVTDASCTTGVPGTRIRQGYLAVGPPVAVRVRIEGGAANLNIKTATTTIKRREFEYDIPIDDARELMNTSVVGAVIDKVRYRIVHEGNEWEVDVFDGQNDGLIVAELELPAVDAPFERPGWLGAEVSGDPRYLNTHLAIHPYSTWSDCP